MADFGGTDDARSLAIQQDGKIVRDNTFITKSFNSVANRIAYVTASQKMVLKK